MRKLFRRQWPPAALAVVGLVLSASPLFSQATGTIAGVVTDASNSGPLASAQVSIPALNIGALTQQNGRFILINVPAGSHTIAVQRIGFREQEAVVTVSSGATVTQNFAMQQEALALDEIIVTGTPGGAQRRAIGNTVTSVQAANVVQDVTVNSMQELLGGRTPGLQFTAAPGSVGTGSPIQIRGVGSFDTSRSQPLIYVDGVRVNNSSGSGPVLGEGKMVSVLDDFNPEDIESVEIIKGPAAASLYGTEASSGVIQIITKKGREGRPEFSLSIRQGTNFMMDPAGKLGTFWTCPTDNAPGPTACPNRSDLVPYNMYDEANRYIADGYFPWKTDNLYSYGHGQGYNLDVRGGQGPIRYFVSTGYDKDTGIVYWDTDEDFRLRANVGVLFSEMFSMDISTGFGTGKSRFEGATVSDGGLWQDMVWSNGFYLDRITPFDKPGANPRLGGFQEHLPTDVEKTEATREFSRFTGSGTLNFTTPEWNFGNSTAAITSRAVVGIDRSWDSNVNLFPLEPRIVPEHLQAYTNTWASVYSETDQGEMTYERPINNLLTFDYALTANVNLADRIGLATSVGAQYYITQLDRFQNSGNGFASPLSRTVNQLSQPQIVTTYQFIENKSLGFYIDERVSLNDRLYFSVGARFDDNSTFGADADPLIYPKVNGAWVVSEEGFWPLAQMNLFRVRGAWGKAGRQPSALAGLNTYAAISGPGGAPAIRPASPGNPKIEPEVSTELELGFDWAVIDDRLAGEFTHYWRRDERQLLALVVPSSFGIPGSVDQNLGRIDNWGWEATLNARVYQSDNLNFDLDFRADHTDNEIMDLGSFPGTTNIRVGLPFPNLIIANWPVSAQFDPAAPAAGNFTNAFGKRITGMCDSGISLAPEGAAIPGQYGMLPGGTPAPCRSIPGRNLLVGPAFATHTFGISPRLGLFNNQLQVFALMEGQYGRWNLDNGHAWGHIYNNSQVSRVEDDALWVVGDLMNGTGNDFGKSIYDADFWKLREVGARYNLPQSIVERTGASRASIAVSGRNLTNLWQRQPEIYGHPVTDPEFGDPTSFGGQGNFYSQPPLTNISATLRVAF